MVKTANFDRTYSAIKRQLKAMNAEDYEVGLFHRDDDRMLPRFWTAQEIIKSISWLKVMNSKGYDIFIRPKGSQGLVFFDDLNMGTIEKMKNDGYSPAVIIESSPMNFHGWLKVSETPIPANIATVICKSIAKRYQGDNDSADWRHYGRLAGFTNRKPKHIDENGRQPFVLLSSGNGKMADKAGQLISQAIEAIEQLNAQNEIKQASIANRKTSGNLKDANQFYESELLGLESRYGSTMDCSRADWMIVNKMINLGYSESSIKEAMEVFSPALDSRTSHSDDYINTTLDNAFGNNKEV